MKETYKVKRPDKITWGDPWYMKEFSGEKLQSLIVDFEPPKYCDARVVLEEQPMKDYPDVMLNTMTIYLAPKHMIKTYMQNMMFEFQQHTEKDIGVDTAQYYLNVDGQDDTIHTGGDGYWGSYQELFRMLGDKKMLDAVVIIIAMPEYETMDSMRDYLNYFFKDVEQIENVVEPEETAEEEQSEEPQQNM